MENDFDKRLQDALYDYEAEYDSADWDDLEARLDEEPDRSLPPFWLKGLEALVFLLIVITVYNFWGPQEEAAATVTEPAAGQQAEQTAAQASVASTVAVAPIEQLATAEPTAKLPSNTAAPTANSTVAMGGQEKLTAIAAPAPITPSSSNNELNTVLPENELNTAKLSETNEPVQASNSTLNKANSEKELLPAAETLIEEQGRDWLSARLVLPLYPERLAGSLIEERPRRTKLRKPFQVQWRYGVLFSTDANSNSSYGRGRIGESVGFNFHVLLSERIAVESGIGLSFKRFDYNGPLRQYDDDGTLRLNEEVNEQRNTQITTLYIPLTVQYEVYENKKWRGYLTAGGNVQGVLWQRHNGTLRQTQSQQGGQVRTVAQINSVGAEQGLSQGGTFEENYFLSWSLGVGLERQISNHWHLFVQPNFQQAFTSYGERASRLGAFSLNMGVRSTFNKIDK